MIFEKINTPHRIVIGASPKDADLAFVSINELENAGHSITNIVKEYGYNEQNLPTNEQLRSGYAFVSKEKAKDIIFIVTVEAFNSTKFSLEKNLYSALTELKDLIRKKTVWLPLMATGKEGLAYEESYNIIAKAINRFQSGYPTEALFLISLPPTDKSKSFLKALEEGAVRNTLLEDFHTKFNRAFYLVGAMWDSIDQTDRFIKEGIWEKGHEDESYSEEINSVNIDDIIIIKSTFASSGISYLRVKAIGNVIENPKNGALLKVNWRVINYYDVENLGYYRATIANAGINDTKIILSKIDLSILQSFLSNDEKQIQIQSSTSKIAHLISDTEKGTDYLNISKDVIAFARVMAAKSFEPPLAIALFGKWGSGKSFFMRKLKEDIENLSRRNPNKLYCEGIVHIHFNAWPYMDANLWASFVSRIFEGLYEYITNNSKSEAAKKEIEEKLSSSLNIANEQKQLLEGQRDAIQEQINTLEEKRKDINKQLEENIKKLQTQTAWDIIEKANSQFKAREKILNALESNETFVISRDEFKYIIPEKYWEDPIETYHQIQSKKIFLKEFFKRDRVWKNFLWLSIILVIIFSVPFVLELFSQKISKVNFLLPPATLSFLLLVGTVWKRAELVYRKLQPLIASFWQVKEDYEKKKERALLKFQQEEKALKLEIEKGKDELLSINGQLQKAEALKADLEFKINNAIATEALYSFIEKRSKSDDYKKHLGIISVIRKDFETLNGLFTDHNQEIVNTKDVRLFRDKFKKPLQRIILYVDDLDRCPEENVVQVLEAVNLLMAFPLFIVIVGVDPRWVKNALTKKYSLQFTGKLTGGYEKEEGIEMIEPSDYLEKIFQVPFHLKDAQSQSVSDMIKQLAESKQETSKSLNNDEERFEKDEEGQTPIVPNTEKNVIEVNDTLHFGDDIDISEKENIELLQLSDHEIAFMQDMGEIIGPNPRAIKRFVNIFKIVKAHAEFTVNQNSTDEELLAVLFLLALSAGKFKKLAPSFENYINSNTTDNRNMSLYLHESNNIGELQSLKQQLDKVLYHKTNYQTIQRSNINVFKDHNNFIKRFTFKNI